MEKTLQELMGQYEHCLDTVRQHRQKAMLTYRMTRDPEDGRRAVLLDEMESDLLYSMGMLARDLRR